ncbi:reverse transcriptase domain-containing protein [Trichonephila clavipes]|nr:reverse transcriptase domain-containing protein [Trichonephila clavipes]
MKTTLSPSVFQGSAEVHRIRQQRPCSFDCSAPVSSQRDLRDMPRDKKQKRIFKQAKITCYTDGIAIWNTNSDLSASDRTSFCPSIMILNSTINQISSPKHIGFTLYTELRFTKHIEAFSLRALKKLNVLRKLCGSTRGSKRKSLLNTQTTIVRPFLEYTAPICAPASSSSKEKIGTVQYRASKMIIGAVFSTNNLSAEFEYGLTLLESRRKLATVKFTKIKNNSGEHISNVTFRAWTNRGRLKRSSTLHDEAHFWLNGYVNKQNCRIWSEANPQVYVETPLHPEKLTVWCVLWAGGIIAPYFYKNDEGHNVTVNGDL